MSAQYKSTVLSSPHLAFYELPCKFGIKFGMLLHACGKGIRIRCAQSTREGSHIRGVLAQERWRSYPYWTETQFR